MDADSRWPAKPMRLRLTASDLGGNVVRLFVRGEVDMSTSDDLADELRSLIGTRHARRLVIDLAGVTFMASSGIAVLVSAHRLAHDHHADLVVVNCQPMVTRVLEITGVDKLLSGAGDG